MKRYLRLYRLFLSYSLMKSIEYKQSFIIWSFVSIGWLILNLLFFTFLFSHVDTIAGWNEGQVFVILGLYFMFEFIIWGLLSRNMNDLNTKINTGNLDLELTKPINLQFLLSTKNIGLDDLHSFILGLGIVVYGLNKADIQSSMSGIFLFFISFIIASFFIYAGWFTSMCIAFWTQRAQNLYFIFPRLNQLWRIPQPFYQGVLKFVVSVVFPVTLVTTVPANFLFNRPSWVYTLWLCIFTIILLIISQTVLNLGLKHYSSASS